MPALTIAPITIAQAFRFMELGPVSSFSDDTPQARDAADSYPEALRLCLEACDWSFGSFSAALPEVSPAMLPPGFAATIDMPYTFALPGGASRLIEVGDRWTRWRRDGALIRASDAAPLAVRYTVDTLPEDAQPATFRMAVAGRLAALLAPRWNGAAANTDQAEGRAQQLLAQAMRSDARQAASARYDGRSEQSDWAEEAVR